MLYVHTVRGTLRWNCPCFFFLNGELDYGYCDLMKAGRWLGKKTTCGREID